MTTATAIQKKQLGQILEAKGLITPEQIDRALTEQRARGHTQLLGEVIVDLGFCTEDQIVAALADAYEVPYAKLTPKLVDPRAIELLPRETVEKHCCLPLFKVDGVLTLAMSEPANVFLIEEVGRQTGCTVQVVAASSADIQAVLQQYLPDANVFVIDDIMEDVSGENFELIEAPAEDITDLEAIAGDSPVIKLVNYLIYCAVKDGASDIHIEPDDRALRVRYRIDGRLAEKLRPPAQMQAAIVSRIKIMAGLYISERRLPQDGGIHVMMEGRPIDLRVSTLPNKYGEKTVIRVIDNRSIMVNLEKLGFQPEMLKEFRRRIAQPYGLTLVTGPTGSGKSTTLYSMLAQINSDQINISTVEDPVEFNLKGVNQFQVNEKIHFTFANALRALLRQDPDVIMVGEIRDPDTAKIAVQAALTGHMVFSTLHTNDAPGAATRLYNVGVEPYLISAALVAALAQRLVRKICPNCKEAVAVEPNARLLLDKVGVEADELYEGRGCAKCNNTGYKGRIGIYELMVPDDEIREAIARRASLDELRKLALAKGMVPLQRDGLAKAVAGITTINEVLRVTAT